MAGEDSCTGRSAESHPLEEFRQMIVCIGFRREGVVECLSCIHARNVAGLCGFGL